MLANIFLHYVLDEWFEREVQPRLKGRAFLIRYADDFVMGFACEEDARRVMDVLPKRFGKYGLTLHPEKTRLVPFERPSDRPERPGDLGRRTPAGTFDLLGFTHYWGRSRNGILGGEAQDVQEPIPPWTEGASRSGAERIGTDADADTAPDTESEAPRPLRVLRDHGQRGCVERDSGGVSSGSGGNGLAAAIAAAKSPGIGCIACWSVIRFRRRSSSTRCTVAQRRFEMRSRVR